MAISERSIDQAYSDLKDICGGVRNDYYALLYLEQEFKLDRDHSVSQVAFGGNDFGIDGYHFDENKKNFYLFQFKWTESHTQFKGSFQRLIDAGMDRIFGGKNQNQEMNPLLVKIKSCLVENTAVIDRICFHFVFNGDAGEADRSQVLDKLREDLENKKYLIDQYLGREIMVVIEFRSSRTRQVGLHVHTRKTHTYSISLDDVITRKGPDNQLMTIGFIPLSDLQNMYSEMGQRFFERNIRASLAETEAVNRSIEKALKNIILDEKDDPRVFTFNHNGVTLSAEALDTEDGQFQITEPRLLNGAQTVGSLNRFLKSNEGNMRLSERKECVKTIRVMCRIITQANPDFITTVTINNNRQNPVDPWNLRANDMIQLEIQDKFRNELCIYYERQERAFQSLSDEDLDDLGITEYKAIELTKLARTLLVSDGNIDKLLRFRDVFEDDKLYDQIFNQARLKADARKIILCYKVQFRLSRIANDIVDKGSNKYAFVQRARNILWALLCQAILNDRDIDKYADNFGKGLSIEAQYTDWVSSLATTRCRFILTDLISDKQFADRVSNGDFSFLRTNVAYKKSMEIAYKKWKWVEKRLK